MKKISRLVLRHWSTGVQNVDMIYDGNGKWHLDLAIPTNSYGYKVLPFGLDGEQPTGAQFPSASTPTGPVSSYDPVNDKYWHIVPVQAGAANATPKSNGSFVVPDVCKGVTLRYAVNYILDESAPKDKRDALLTHLIHNGEALENTLDRSTWPRMIAPFCWGVSWKTWASNQNKDNADGEINKNGDGTLKGYKPCMSTHASGASLMEGLARLPENLI